MNKTLFILALLLLPAALLIHLGVMVFIDDEAIRTLVAQEMLWSGNYVSPTMHGDVYLNKPPLFNWLLAISFTVFGGATEFSARFPTVVSLLGFAATTYYFSRKHFSRYNAGVHALMVITCGRMLFWDSMLGLIDVTFSWVVYAQIMLLYEHGRKGEWWKAFGWSYALTAVGFLLKGLPSIVFQGITIFALLTWLKAWKQFIRPAHLLSGVACVAVLAAYYWVYSGYVDLNWVVDRLFIESGKRTAAAHSAWENVLHFVSFPFEMGYHFLPWTILAIYFLRRGTWRELRQNDFAAFCLVAFLANFPVYWLSPNTYPRYLLMLFPLFFGAVLFLHTRHLRQRTNHYKFLRYLLLGAMSLVAVAIPFIPLVPETEIVTYPWLKSLPLGAAAGGVVWTGWRSDRGLLLKFAVFLLIARVTFNFFVLPPRAAGDERGIRVRETANQVVAAAGQDSLAIYGFSLIEPATGWYLTAARGRVVPRVWEGFDAKTNYIVSKWQYPTINVESQDSLYLRHRQVYYPVGKFTSPPTERATMGDVLLDGMGTGKD